MLKKDGIPSGIIITAADGNPISNLEEWIKHLSAKKHGERVSLTVYSDSEYVVKSFTEKRLIKWVRNGWRNTSGDVKNKDLWKRLLVELNKKTYLTLHMVHIRSHQVEKCKDPIKKKELLKDPNIIGNMVADRLADYKRHKKLKELDNLK